MNKTLLDKFFDIYAPYETERDYSKENLLEIRKDLVENEETELINLLDNAISVL